MMETQGIAKPMPRKSRIIRFDLNQTANQNGLMAPMSEPPRKIMAKPRKKITVDRNSIKRKSEPMNLVTPRELEYNEVATKVGMEFDKYRCIK